MKYKLIAACSMVVLAQSAHAITVATGDLILGIRSTDSNLQGYGTSYVIDLGQASLYNGSSNITVGGAATTGADLTALYGANWSSRTDLQWAVIGGDSRDNLYASKAQSDSMTIPDPWQIQTSNGRGFVYNSLLNVYGNLVTGGLDDSPATVNTSFATYEQFSYTNGWRGYLASGGNPGQAGSTGNVDFYSFGSPGIEGNPTQTLSLFHLTGSAAGSYVGSFSLGSDGSVAFVPEPSSAMLVVMTALPLISRRRRRN